VTIIGGELGVVFGQFVMCKREVTEGSAQVHGRAWAVLSVASRIFRFHGDYFVCSPL
jgi:hypothetical protein